MGFDRRSVPSFAAALLAASCVTITEEDPRRARAILYPEPVPVSAWAVRPVDGTRAPPPSEWVPPESERRAGVLVFLEGEGSGDEVEPVLERFSEAGFRILRMRIDPLVDPPRRMAVARPEEIDDVAGELARAVDARLAGVARAVVAELDRIDVAQPAEPLRPLVLAGVGLGACVVPPVAARLGGGFDAAVLIGGGASLFEVVAAASLETDGVELEVGSLTAPQREFFGDVYLAESRLDPFHTARFLAGKPVLMIHARFDEVVPHWTGDVLHGRLGSPMRLRVLGTHDDLLEEVEDRAEWIATWVEDAVRR
ncbi:MAG: hypothetical protein ACF8XB_12050 [Planctomycetota bacterium JB042]